MHFSQSKDKSQVCEPLLPSPPLSIPIWSQVHFLMGSSCKGWRTCSHRDVGRNVCSFSFPTGRRGAWNWVTHDETQPPGTACGQHGHWAFTCLSATSGFPPPFCGLGIKSSASDLVPHFSSSILSPSYSQTPLAGYQPWLGQYSHYVSAPPQDKDGIALVSNAIRQVFLVLCPLPTDPRDCAFPCIGAVKLILANESGIYMGHFWDRAFNYQCRTPQDPLFSQARWQATFEMVTAPSVWVAEWSWWVKPLADVQCTYSMSKKQTFMIWSHWGRGLFVSTTSLSLAWLWKVFVLAALVNPLSFFPQLSAEAFPGINR